MYSMPVRTVCTFFTLPSMTCDAKMLPSVASSQPGTIDRQVLLRRRKQPRVLRIDLVVLLQRAAQQDAVHELVREVALA